MNLSTDFPVAKPEAKARAFPHVLMTSNKTDFFTDEDVTKKQEMWKYSNMSTENKNKR